jgi:hypothetical protein
MSSRILFLIFILYATNGSTSAASGAIGSSWISSQPYETTGDYITPRLYHAYTTYQEFNESTQTNQTILLISGGKQTFDELSLGKSYPSLNDLAIYYVEEARWKMLANVSKSSDSYWGSGPSPTYRQSHVAIHLPYNSVAYPNTILFVGGK